MRTSHLRSLTLFYDTAASILQVVCHNTSAVVRDQISEVFIPAFEPPANCEVHNIFLIFPQAGSITVNPIFGFNYTLIGFLTDPPISGIEIDFTRALEHHVCDATNVKSECDEVDEMTLGVRNSTLSLAVVPHAGLQFYAPAHSNMMVSSCLR